MKYDFGKYSYYALVCAAFFTPFTLPLGRISVAIALVLILLDNIKSKKNSWFPPVAWLALSWIVLACIVTINGVNPEIGIPRLEKLIWFSAIPVTACLVTDIRRLRMIMYAFVTGSVILSLDIIVMNTIHAANTFRAGEFNTLTDAIINEGSMTDGQILSVCILATLSVIIVQKLRYRKLIYPVVSLVLQICAMILNFKRGSWITVLAMIAIFIAIKINWKALLVLLAAVLLAIILPPVQERLATLRTEFNPDGGGRATMWVKIAPKLIKQYPGGIGYRSLTNGMMHDIFWRVERDRDHLHSNLLQVLVATGWAGFALYLAWMSMAFLDGCRFTYRSKDNPDGEKTYALGLTLMLLSLYINGVVEYNFGDAEIVLLYSIIMGILAAGVKRSNTVA
jgi:O-antigen ligase